MKYGESSFDVFYLLFAIIMGISILVRKKDAVGRLSGTAVLILGAGDAFHLVPRVLNYFVTADFSFWLGFGKLVTSLTMTVFYMLMYYLWYRLYGEKKSPVLAAAVYALFILRTVLCLLPQNRWFTNESPVDFGIIRNVPFVALGCVIIVLFFKKRKAIRHFRAVWLLITLSFAFYIPVTVGASFVPHLGMLMLPKTVCYMILIRIFQRYAVKENGKA